jgi:hypothetical protein
MANIKSFPNNQDVYIGAEDVMKWLHGRTSGVFAAEGNASVSALADSTMAVTVSDGLGWIANAGKDGVVWWIDNEAVNGSKLRLNIDPADGVLNRIDRIIVEWKTTNYVDYPEVKVLKGSASSKATAPALTNNSTVRQISLAKINIASGTTAITASMITDERLDASVCGLVTENISIDTSVVNAQFRELLDLIEANLKQITDEQILDKSITVQKLADETLNYINATNALDNSNFRNLIAQAGIGGKHGTVTYAADRWILNSGTVSYTDGVGLTLNGSMTQRLGTTVTEGSAFVGVASGSAEITFNASENEVTITSNGGVLTWAALYPGVYTDQTIPEYQPKGYTTEFAECRRYYKYYVPGNDSFVASIVSNNAYIGINFQEDPMRTSAISYEGSGYFYMSATSYEGRTSTNVSIHKKSKSSVTLKVGFDSSVGNGFGTVEKSGGQYFALSADL